MSRLHVGSMGWSYDFWKGNFYPKNLAPNELLAYYGTQFDTVEVDGTFYRIPRAQTVLDWKEKTPGGFLFSLKFPRVITHVKMLRNCEEETRVFLERVSLLQEKLGPLLLQFPSAFRTEHLPFLSDFLRTLPKQHRYVVEVRNRKLLGDSLYSILRDNDVALAWVDSASMPLVNEITSCFIYVRWEGDRGKITGTIGKVEADKTDKIKSWADKLRQFLDEKMEVFGYFSKYYSGHPPTDVRALLKLMQVG
jgi:uncharacterized protein YecE (DUF72 family)